MSTRSRAREDRSRALRAARRKPVLREIVRRSAARRFAVAAVLCVAFSASCRSGPEPGPFDIDVSVSPTPATVGSARVIVQVRDSAGTPVSDARVVIEATMDHAGMETLVDTARQAGGGRYVVDALPLRMAGDWLILPRVEHPALGTGRGLHRLRVVSEPPSSGPGARPDSSAPGEPGASKGGT